MNTLRFLANTVKRESNCIYLVQKQLKQNEITNLKRATAAIFIRNTNTGNISRPSKQGESKLFPQISILPQGQVLWPATTLNCHQSLLYSSRREFSTKQCPDQTNKSDTKQKSSVATTDDIFGEASNLGLFAKFKLMYKMYWYVLIPVHVVTSAGWLIGFYYLSQSGVDVPAVLQYLHLSETIIEKVQGSSLGHWAIAYLCYKVATPLRYAVTLGGTTISIKYLVQQGHIKPMPTKAQFLKMYEDKKAQRAADKASKDKAASSNEPQQPHEQK
ncbi:uncharacterized protein C18orf19 homolog A [Haematobia irritans]|uniref:uncharacterized protein C18orf19 homolog A n=1 Tax=Haematobia irritans TaxID=7368 RepID=UPI003F4F94BA